MKYGQFIKALKDKGVKVDDGKRHPTEEYPPILLAKILKQLGL
ncbi:hypothetical protein [uncultured Parasutterella sp.]|nr:hypothetical protein [uncultured Parasutterella sp.]